MKYWIKWFNNKADFEQFVSSLSAAQKETASGLATQGDKATGYYYGLIYNVGAE